MEPIIDRGMFRALNVKNNVLIGIKTRIAVLDAFCYVDAS